MNLILNDSIKIKWMNKVIYIVNKAIDRTADYLNDRIQVNRLKRKRCKGWSIRKGRRVVIYTALAMQANMDPKERITRFDTDSVPIGIDNRCSACILHVAEDFVGQLRDSSKVIKGFGGTKTTNVKVGTLSWTWNDDYGVPHKFTIPNSYFVPSGKVRLLSPQH